MCINLFCFVMFINITILVEILVNYESTNQLNNNNSIPVETLIKLHALDVYNVIALCIVPVSIFMGCSKSKRLTICFTFSA